VPVNSSTILVSWQPPLDTKQNGIIRAYQIYIQPKKTVSGRGWGRDRPSDWRGWGRDFIFIKNEGCFLRIQFLISWIFILFKCVILF
jgi:hypothetical protein